MRVLFVCLGNVCRSPTAAAVFDELVREAGLGAAIEVDSCGTGSHFAGRGAAAEAVRVARAAGLDLSTHRARGLDRHDFETADLLVAMDRQNLADLRALAPPGRPSPPAVLLLDEVPELGRRDVPDPYLGEASFEEVLDLVRTACAALLARLLREGRFD